MIKFIQQKLEALLVGHIEEFHPVHREPTSIMTPFPRSSDPPPKLWKPHLNSVQPCTTFWPLIPGDTARDGHFAQCVCNQRASHEMKVRSVPIQNTSQIRWAQRVHIHELAISCLQGSHLWHVKETSPCCLGDNASPPQYFLGLKRHRFGFAESPCLKLSSLNTLVCRRTGSNIQTITKIDAQHPCLWGQCL